MKIKVIVKFATIFFIVHISGCTLLPKHADGPAFSPVAVPPGNAVIYFYRPERVSMSATTNFMSIPLSADNCFAMVNGGYYAYITTPGKVTVGSAAMRSGMVSFSLDVIAGDVRYVDVSFGWMPTPEYKEVAEARALQEITKLRQISVCEK